MIQLHTWSHSDLDVLRWTVGNPAMMAHLGGPESTTQIIHRHRRYLAMSEPDGAMFTVRLCNDGIVAGTVGYWEKLWNGERIYEAGWMVLPEYAGRGIATEAAMAVVRRASMWRRNGSVHAFPSVDNAASNRVCERAGFTNLGECNFEYPKGRMMRVNDWRLKI